STRPARLTPLRSSAASVGIKKRRLEYAGASIDLNNYTLSLQATQKTYLKINGLSLFGML
ncbi:hypothetical protein OEZ81_26695, partial [Leclercia adecarboxylata]|uniref:hypothetical protein n=1 Tax=Leclercia adecarboxylata TaxID=83655 RepID=UPI00234E29C6